MDDPFAETLTTLETALTAEPADGEALVQGFRALRRDFPEDPTPDDVRRAFALCHGALALSDLGPAAGRVSYAVIEMLKRLMIDPEGQYRDHIQGSFNHHTAFGRPMPKSRFNGPIPAAYLPVTVEEARALVQPLLTSFEATMDEAPIKHLYLAWEVLEHPVAPFDRVFDGWLKEVEARGLGLGGSHSALRRAMAFASLAEEGRQRVTRSSIDTLILPVLDDPNPVLAAAAARFLGRIHEDVTEFYNHGTPWALPDLLIHIAERPAPTRRAIAGGFLNGFADCEDPFALLRKDERLEGFDLDGWVIAVLADTPEEVLIPSAQAFWFYIHEGFAFDAPFVARLIDEGHDWLAMMCATEIRGHVEGMERLLRRLATSDDREAAAAATRHLTSFYGIGAPA